MKFIFWILYLSLILAIVGGMSGFIISVTSLEAYLDILKGAGVVCLATVLAAVTRRRAPHLLAIGSGYFYYIGLSKAVPLLLDGAINLTPAKLALVETMPYIMTPILVIGYFIGLHLMQKAKEAGNG